MKSMRQSGLYSLSALRRSQGFLWALVAFVCALLPGTVRGQDSAQAGEAAAPVEQPHDAEIDTGSAAQRRTERTGRTERAEDFLLTNTLSEINASASLLTTQEQDSDDPMWTPSLDDAPGSTPGFGNVHLTLTRALEIALANDLGLEVSALATDVARFSYAGSWGAFDPILTASGSYSDNEFETGSDIGGAEVLVEDNFQFNTGLNWPTLSGGTFTIGFDHTNTETNNQFATENPSTTDFVRASYTQPLLRGAWKEYATSNQREAELNYQKQIHTYRQTRQELLLAVTNSYWDLVAAEEAREVAMVTLDLGRRQLEQNQRRLDAGVGTEVEVLQAETNLAVRQQELLETKVAVDQAADTLKGRLYPGTSSETWERKIQAVTDLPEIGNQGQQSWMSALNTALENRPVLAQQRLDIKAAEVRLERSLSDRRPGLDLVLGANSRGFDGDASDAFSEALAYDFPSLSASINFSLPLGNRTAENAARSARAALRSARLAYDQLETNVAAEVRGALRQVVYQAEALIAARKTVSLSRRQLDAEEVRLREGLSTTFQVLEFQRELASALSGETAARVTYAKALAALERFKGTLGEDTQ